MSSDSEGAFCVLPPLWIQAGIAPGPRRARWKGWRNGGVNTRRPWACWRGAAGEVSSTEGLNDDDTEHLHLSRPGRHCRLPESACLEVTVNRYPEIAPDSMVQIWVDCSDENGNNFFPSNIHVYQHGFADWGQCGVRTCPRPLV